MALSERDFKYFRKLSEEDITKHDTLISQVNSPDEVIAAYNGVFQNQDAGVHEHNDMMIENYLFIFIATALPSLFFQIPRINIRAKRGELDFEAGVLNAWANIDFDERAKEENQLCIIDALLPYGYGCMKTGYNSRTGKVSKAKELFTGETGVKKTDNMEGDVEFLKFERTIGVRQSPKKAYLDSTQPFGKGQRETYEYERTLQQLMDSNLYTLSSNFISHYGARKEDRRDVKLKLFEQWLMIDGWANKLCWVEGWPEELMFVKTQYDKLPRSLLRFNKMSDILYSIAHGTLALSAQKELNYQTELRKKHIDNARNQHLINMNDLTDSGKRTLKDNQIGGIVETQKSVLAGTAMPLQSAVIDPTIIYGINDTRDYLKLLLSVTGGRGGGLDSKLATVERQKAVGDVLRSSGLQDAIRDFIIDQIKQRIKNVLRMGSPQMILKMTGENLYSPRTGQSIAPGEELQLGGQGGYALKDLITGNIETDFIFDVDIQSAAKPDFPVIRKQLAEGIALGVNAQMALAQESKKFRVDLAVEDYFATFDTVANAQKYIQDMTKQDKAKLIMQQQAAAQEEGGAPTPESVTGGTEQVRTGTEGL